MYSCFQYQSLNIICLGQFFQLFWKSSEKQLQCSEATYAFVRNIILLRATVSTKAVIPSSPQYHLK